MKFHRFCIRLMLCLLPGTCILSQTAAHAAGLLQTQTYGTLSAQLISPEGQPLPFVSVAIQHSSFGTITDEEGKFSLRLPSGEYQLLLSAVGRESKTLPIRIQPNGSLSLGKIILAERTQQLAEVAIEANQSPYAVQETPYVAKMPLKALENPQSYQTINARLLEEQLVTNLDDALKNAPGISKLWESTGRGGDGAAYYSLRGFPVQPKLMNGLPALVNGSLDPATIERIEVIKGPSGTLFGSSLVSYGGLINVVTKKPTLQQKGSISYTAGSFGLNRLTADINSPLNQDKSLLMRVNTALHTQNSFQDAGLRRSFLIAPSFAYQVSDRLSLHLSTDWYWGEGTNQTMLFFDRRAPLRVHTPEELGYNTERSYTSNALTLNTPAFSLQGELRYQLGKGWEWQSAVSRSVAKADGYYTYLYESSQYYPVEGVVFSRYLSRQNSHTLSTDIQQNLTGRFQIGRTEHQLLFGIDYFHQRLINNSSSYVGNGQVYIGNAALADVNRQVFGITEESRFETDYDSGQLTQAGADALLANARFTPAESSQEVYSAYASDVIGIGNRLSLMAALRFDYFVDGQDEEKNQAALSPKLGATYQLLPDRLALFANYLNGFSNVSPVIEEGKTYSFSPEQANQWEAGLKYQTALWDASLSYYDIRVSNKVRQELDAEGRPVYVQDGEITSQGFEAALTAHPIDGLNLVLGYSYNQSENLNVEEEFAGRRPESAGPEHLANAWLQYQLQQGSLKGFGLGFGGNYGSAFAPMNRLTSGRFTLPAYTILNASAFYEGGSYRLSLKVNNLSDREYFNGWSTLNPQMPRNLMFAISYRF